MYSIALVSASAVLEAVVQIPNAFTEGSAAFETVSAPSIACSTSMEEQEHTQNIYTSTLVSTLHSGAN